MPEAPIQTRTGICRCGRPVNTPADLARWHVEFPDGPPAPEPSWAAAICWSVSDSCGRRPLITLVQISKDPHA